MENTFPQIRLLQIIRVVVIKKKTPIKGEIVKESRLVYIGTSFISIIKNIILRDDLINTFR